MRPSGHIIVDVPAKEEIVLSSHLFGSLTSFYRATLKSGERHYVRLERNMGNALGAGVFGIFGAAVAGGGEGDYVFRRGNETEAAVTHKDCI